MQKRLQTNALTHLYAFNRCPLLCLGSIARMQGTSKSIPHTSIPLMSLQK